MKCFDIVSMLVEEASSQFRDNRQINKSYYTVLEQYCNGIDKIIERYDVNGFDAEIDQDSREIRLSIDAMSVESHGYTGLLNQLIERSLRTEFEWVDEDNARITLVYGSIWE